MEFALLSGPVLIANRGEIAVRIARALAELGVESVAIYASDDSDSLHVKAADRALALPGRGVAAYLNINSIIAAGKEAGCVAVHPGYGFLSESAEFARACEAEGLSFVGPTPDMLEKLGDKAAARALALKLGVPLLSGTNKATSLDEVRAFLEKAPETGGVMLKAVRGGGGRGVRIVQKSGDLDAVYAACASEAEKAFGSGELYVAEYLPRARHIEVQILGDGKGGLVHLGERDCTLQRRHQKLVECAPAPGLNEEVRAALLRDALKMAAEVNYRGAATFEFLVDADKGDRYWFMEVNPRIQVEHTVTEEVTGVDLVQAQLRITAGETLADIGISQDAIAKPSKFAVQLRVNMEKLTATGEILPASGTLTRYDMPSGPGVRIDGFGYSGYRVMPTYDSLLAKVIVSVNGADDKAYQRLLIKAQRALKECGIGGVETNLYFQRALLAHPDLAANKVFTRFIEEKGAELVAGAVALQEAEAPATMEVAAQEVQQIDVPAGNIAVSAPMVGYLAEVLVAEGDVVAANQPIAVLEAMKMEHIIVAPEGGIVTKIASEGGAQLEVGSIIVASDPAGAGEGEVVDAAEQSIDAIPPSLAEILARKDMLKDEFRPDAVARRRKTGQQTARENVAAVCDPETCREYGALVLAEQRRRRSMEELIKMSPADGLITGTARVNSEQFPGENSKCAIIAYDYTVFAGTQGRANHKKMDRMFNIAERDNLPLILFAEGGGGR